MLECTFHGSCTNCDKREECRQDARNKWHWDPTHPFARRWYFWSVNLLSAAAVGLAVGFGGAHLLQKFLI